MEYEESNSKDVVNIGQTKPKIKIPHDVTGFNATLSIVKEFRLNTVCEEAACPNIMECWNKSHATFMILGSICTRKCSFCNVATGMPDKLDPHEPEKVAQAVKKLNLKHVVITSVDRDDLSDGGANHFAQTIYSIKNVNPNTTIEVLTPDFLKKPEALEIVVRAKPDIYNHNLETVPSLYRKIRPGARYFNSLNLLKNVKEIDGNMFTKSGLMVGLGESIEELFQVMDDLRVANVDFLTVGQYLRPSAEHAEIKKYYTSEEFGIIKQRADAMGFLMTSASDLTRSSYHADEDFQMLKQKQLERNAKNSPN